jgi:putative ATP-dependent endonuclease of OLD family
LADTAIRARLAHEIGREDVEQILKAEGKRNLEELELSFRSRALPTSLGLGLTGSPRVSLAALVGLTAAKEDARLPLAAWGSGTQRLAALAVANANQRGAPIVLIDEVEKGLEPYRQRQLAHNLRDGPSQGFLTTHSTSVVEACLPAALWHVTPTGSIGRITGKAAEHVRSDPEAFLSRFIVVAEGSTEVGFLTELLSRCFRHELGVLGVSVTDAGGSENALSLIESLASAGLRVGGLVDNEGLMAGRWKAVRADLGDLIVQWPSGCIEQTIVPLFPLPILKEVVAEGDLTGERLRTLQERLQTDSKDWDALSAAGADMHQAVISAALGDVPGWLSEPGEQKRFKKHSQHWFKNVDGGRELLRKVLMFGVWPSLEPLVWPMVVKLGDTLRLDPIASGDLPATGQ